MKSTTRWMVLGCATVALAAACGKKSDDSSSSSPAAGSGGTPAPVAPATPVVNASLKENPDGTAAVDLTLPDANGVNTSHKGMIDRTRETELRSDDGKSLAAARAFEGFGILMALQYQADRSDGRLFVLVKNQSEGYQPIVSAVALERNSGLNKAMSIVSDIGQACKYTVSQSFAALAQYFRVNPAGNLDQYAQAKRDELKASGESQKCASIDLSTGPDGKATWGAKNAQTPSPEQQAPPPPTTTPGKKSAPDIQEPEKQPAPEQMPDLPLPPPSKQQASPSYPQPLPPVQNKDPRPQQQQQQPTPDQQQTRPVARPDGYHTDWQACYNAGKWRTDGNHYCKHTWWPNCSPETGGNRCKITAESVRSEDSNQSSQPTVERREKGDWTTDFNVCYSAGRWQTDGNVYCKKDWWQNCSPETGGNRCRPVYKD